MKRALLLYVPVLHAGYLKLFEKYHGKIDTLYLLGEDIVAEFSPLHKEIRALDPNTVARIIESLEIFNVVVVLKKKTLRTGLATLKKSQLIGADDEIVRSFIKKYLPKTKVSFERTFLRWDEKNVLSAKPPANVVISRNKFDRDMIARIKKEGTKSSDWWRQVGGAIVKNQKIILGGHNRHVPSEYMPYIDGDPRDVIPAGTQSHLSTAIHAEQLLISDAARKGIRLQGSSIYLTVFPCPVCAKLIAYSGIKKCFFASGHASLDGGRVLKANGVEIIFVK